jgi:hypothetical protein
MGDNKGQVILEVLVMVDTEDQIEEEDRMIKEEIEENTATVEEQIDPVDVVNGNVKLRPVNYSRIRYRYMFIVIFKNFLGSNTFQKIISNLPVLRKQKDKLEEILNN